MNNYNPPSNKPKNIKWGDLKVKYTEDDTYLLWCGEVKAFCDGYHEELEGMLSTSSWLKVGLSNFKLVSYIYDCRVTGKEPTQKEFDKLRLAEALK